MWQTLKERVGQWGGVLAIAPSVAAGVIAGSAAGLFQLLEWATIDQFFRLRPQEPIEKRIVIVTINESDIANLQHWPMTDAVMAKLLKKIKDQEPLAVGLDIYRDLQVEPGHQELIEVFESMPNLVGVEKVGGEPIPPPPTLKKGSQVGASDMLLDGDGKIRRGLILIGNQEGQYIEGLGAKVALMYLNQKGLALQTVDEGKKIYSLGKALFVPLTGNEGDHVSKDTGGYQVLLNYRGKIDNFLHISMTDVMEDRIPPNFTGEILEKPLRDRIVLIGASAESLKDLFRTPYSSTLFSTTKLTPGVVVHANLASQILSAALEGRAQLRAWNRPMGWLWILIWSFIGATGTWTLLRKRVLKNKIFFGEMACGILVPACFLMGGSYLAFLGGWILPVFSPMLAMVSSAILVSDRYNKWQIHKANEELEKANDRLEEYSKTLEVKVAERTQELEKALNDLKATQSQLIHTEKMSSLGQMVAGLAHEINNPISFIYGNLTPAADYIYDLLELIELYQEAYPEPDPEIEALIEQIELDFLRDDLQKILASMKSGATRIRNIVLSLRNFSRLDESDMKPVNIHDGIESTLLILQPRLAGKKIKTIKEYGQLPEVTCYASQLNQVFMNILNNAIDAFPDNGNWQPTDLSKSGITPELGGEEWKHKNGHKNGDSILENSIHDRPCHSPCILIYTEVLPEDWVMIRISDNGCGMSQKVRAKIFDPFFTTKPVGSGTGLGLSTSYSIVVERHKGQIECISTIGQGTEFIINIPVKQVSLQVSN
ncbi:MAG: CHASE2 domain-containing protein [Oscillatoria sp. SIO1A7]|nr:CHASE2 domain-containing protein [Oscillatoria sp. SIO1A7]